MHEQSAKCGIHRIDQPTMVLAAQASVDASTPAEASPVSSSQKGAATPLGISPIRSIAICCAYSVLSTSCVLHNKFLLSSILPHANLLLLAQDLFTISLLMIFSSRLMKNAPGPISSLHIPVTLHHSPGDWVIGLCYSFNVVTGIWCLGYLSVPMFSSIKRCSVIAVWLIEAIFSPTATTWPTLQPLLLLIGGTVLMSYYDLQFSAIGYFFGALSCVFQASSFELGKRLVNHGKDLWSVVLINAIVSLTVQLTYITCSDEMPALSSVVDYLFGGTGTLGDGPSSIPFFITALKSGSRADVAASLSPQKLWAHLILNATFIAVMNYVIFLNCSVNSPLAHAVTGNVKGLVTVTAGVVLFSVPLTSMAVVGIFLGFVGGAWFSWVKVRHQQPKEGNPVLGACVVDVGKEKSSEIR